MNHTTLSVEDMTTLLDLMDSIKKIEDTFETLTGYIDFTNISLMGNLYKIESIIENASPLYDTEDMPDDSVYDRVRENENLTNREKAEYLLGIRDIPVSMLEGL